jgi:hypothetical protein
MNCTNGHTVTGKFCGDCGQPPVAGSDAGGLLAKCFVCQSEQPAANQFCGGCAAPMAPTTADLLATIGDVGTMHKALTALPDTITIAPFTPDFDSGDDVLAEDRMGADDERGDVMGKALIDRLNGVLTDTGTMRLAIEQLATENRALRRDFGVMAKALHMLVRQAAARPAATPTAEPTTEQPPQRQPGAKSHLGNDRPLRILGKSLTSDTPPADTREGADLKGEALMMKAQTARTAQGQRILSSLEIGNLQRFCNRNASLADVLQERPDLGERVKFAVESAA